MRIALGMENGRWDIEHLVLKLDLVSDYTLAGIARSFSINDIIYFNGSDEEMINAAKFFEAIYENSVACIDSEKYGYETINSALEIILDDTNGLDEEDLEPDEILLRNITIQQIVSGEALKEYLKL